MSGRKLSWGWGVVTITLIITMFALTQFVVARAQLSNPGLRIDDEGLYSYSVEQLEDGSLKVRVEVDFHEKLQEYRTATQARAEMFLKEKRSTPVPTTITFAHPLSWPEVSVLREDAGLHVEGYTFAATYGDGRKAMIGGVADEKGLVDLEYLQQIARQQGVTVKGIMVIQGYVEPGGLRQLLNDERICLVDTTAAEIMTELRADEAYRDAPHISVFVPSPYWDLFE